MECRSCTYEVTDARDVEFLRECGVARAPLVYRLRWAVPWKPNR